MESAAGGLLGAQHRAMSDLAPVAQHQCLMNAFPDGNIRNLFLVRDGSDITEKGGTATNDFYTGRCTMFQTNRELGLRITYALLEAVVHAKRNDTASLISVSDVNEALTSMGLESNSEINNETVLFSCPPADELMK